MFNNNNSNDFYKLLKELIKPECKIVQLNLTNFNLDGNDLSQLEEALKRNDSVYGISWPNNVSEDNILVKRINQHLENKPLAKNRQIYGKNDCFINEEGEPLFFHEMFERMVEKYPNSKVNEMLDCDTKSQSLTYKELNEKANKLAHYLLEKKLPAESCIAIYLERSVEYLICLLGIHKAGLPFLAIDTDAEKVPILRIKDYLEAANPVYVLTDDAHQSLMLECKQQVCLLPNLLSNKNLPTVNPQLRLSSHSLAYIIFSSGTTGKPKGILIEHQGIHNLIVASIAALGILPEDNIAQYASVAFDVNLYEIFIALCSGANLVIIPDGVKLDSPALTSLYKKERITITVFTASLLLKLNPKDFIDEKNSKLYLREVLSTGEATNKEGIDPYIEYGIQRFNGYGPSEGTVGFTTVRLNPIGKKGNKSISVGRPFYGSEGFILSIPEIKQEDVSSLKQESEKEKTQEITCNKKNMRRVIQDYGVEGELAITGICLGRGYIDKKLTEEKWVYCDQIGQGKQIIYLTGDKVSYDKEGNFIVHGRIDDNYVKIHGQLIGLNEVEEPLQHHPKVETAIIVKKTYCVPGLSNIELVKLCAFIVPKNNEYCDLTELYLHLKAAKPRFMLPALWKVLKSEEVPRNLSLKVDRKALTKLAADSNEMMLIRFKKKTEPLNYIQKRIYAEISELLGVQNFSIYDDFFDLGGTSIIFMELIDKLKSIYKKNDYPVFHTTSSQEFFHNLTVASLARRLQREKSVYNPLISLRESGDGTPLFLIHSMLGDPELDYPQALLDKISDRPIYGLKAAALTDPSLAEDKIEEYAATYVEAIKQERKNKNYSGPILIGGWSSGGVIAEAMILQLAGYEVYGLIFDSIAPSLFQNMPIVQFKLLNREMLDQIGKLFGVDMSPIIDKLFYEADVSNKDFFISVLDEIELELKKHNKLTQYENILELIRSIKTAEFFYQENNPGVNSTHKKNILFASEHTIELCNNDASLGWSNVISEKYSYEGHHFSILEKVIDSSEFSKKLLEIDSVIHYSWNIPFLAKDFIIRLKYINEIKKSLHAKDFIKSTVINLYGASGIGKTSIARYLINLSTQYLIRIWFNAGSKKEFELECYNFGIKQNIPGLTHENACDKVKAWLEENSQGIIVFDNAHRKILKYIPTKGFHVFITSVKPISQSLDSIENVSSIEVIQMKESEAIGLLATVNQDKTSNVQLAKLLEYQPINIRLACSYIKEYGSSKSEAIHKIHSDALIDRFKLHKQKGVHTKANSVTINLCRLILQLIAQSKSDVSMPAIFLIYKLAFFHNLVIPRIIVKLLLTNQDVIDEEYQLNEVLALLIKYSLLHVSSEGTICMHQRIQRSIQNILLEEKLYGLVLTDVINKLVENFPFEKIKLSHYKFSLVIKPHLSYLYTAVSERDIEPVVKIRLLRLMADTYGTVLNHKRAHDFYAQAKEVIDSIDEKSFYDLPQALADFNGEKARVLIGFVKSLPSLEEQFKCVDLLREACKLLSDDWVGRNYELILLHAYYVYLYFKLHPARSSLFYQNKLYDYPPSAPALAVLNPEGSLLIVKDFLFKTANNLFTAPINTYIACGYSNQEYRYIEHLQVCINGYSSQDICHPKLVELYLTIATCYDSFSTEKEVKNRIEAREKALEINNQVHIFVERFDETKLLIQLLADYAIYGDLDECKGNNLLQEEIKKRKIFLRSSIINKLSPQLNTKIKNLYSIVLQQALQKGDIPSVLFIMLFLKKLSSIIDITFEMDYLKKINRSDDSLRGIRSVDNQSKEEQEKKKRREKGKEKVDQIENKIGYEKEIHEKYSSKFSRVLDYCSSHLHYRESFPPEALKFLWHEYKKYLKRGLIYKDNIQFISDFISLFVDHYANLTFEFNHSQLFSDQGYRFQINDLRNELTERGESFIDDYNEDLLSIFQNVFNDCIRLAGPHKYPFAVGFLGSFSYRLALKNSDIEYDIVLSPSYDHENSLQKIIIDNYFFTLIEIIAKVMLELKQGYGFYIDTNLSPSIKDQQIIRLFGTSEKLIETHFKLEQTKRKKTYKRSSFPLLNTVFLAGSRDVFDNFQKELFEKFNKPLVKNSFSERYVIDKLGVQNEEFSISLIEFNRNKGKSLKVKKLMYHPLLFIVINLAVFNQLLPKESCHNKFNLFKLIEELYERKIISHLFYQDLITSFTVLISIRHQLHSADKSHGQEIVSLAVLDEKNVSSEIALEQFSTENKGSLDFKDDHEKPKDLSENINDNDEEPKSRKEIDATHFQLENDQYFELLRILIKVLIPVQKAISYIIQTKQYHFLNKNFNSPVIIRRMQERVYKFNFSYVLDDSIRESLGLYLYDIEPPKSKLDFSHVLCDSMQESLDPYLQDIESNRFIKLLVKQNIISNSLYLNNYDLNDEDLELILYYAKKHNVKKIDLSHNELTNEGAEEILSWLQSNKLILDINLNGNEICPELLDEIEFFVQQNIEENRIEEIIDNRLLNVNRSTLNLNNLNIRDKGAIYLANKLKNSKNIAIIYLQNNHISSKGAKAMLEVFQINPSIKEIKINVNDIKIRAKFDEITRQRKEAIKLPLENVSDCQESKKNKSNKHKHRKKLPLRPVTAKSKKFPKKTQIKKNCKPLPKTPNTWASYDKEIKQYAYIFPEYKKASNHSKDKNKQNVTKNPESKKVEESSIEQIFGKAYSFNSSLSQTKCNSQLPKNDYSVSLRTVKQNNASLKTKVNSSTTLKLSTNTNEIKFPRLHDLFHTRPSVKIDTKAVEVSSKKLLRKSKKRRAKIRKKGPQSSNYNVKPLLATSNKIEDASNNTQSEKDERKAHKTLINNKGVLDDSEQIVEVVFNPNQYEILWRRENTLSENHDHLKFCNDFYSELFKKQFFVTYQEQPRVKLSSTPYSSKDKIISEKKFLKNFNKYISDNTILDLVSLDFEFDKFCELYNMLKTAGIVVRILILNMVWFDQNTLLKLKEVLEVNNTILDILFTNSWERKALASEKFPALTDRVYYEVQLGLKYNEYLFFKQNQILIDNFFQNEQQLKRIDLSRCYLGDRGVEYLAIHYLANLTYTISFMDLTDNRITDRGAQVLLSVLKYNPCVLEIELKVYRFFYVKENYIENEISSSLIKEIQETIKSKPKFALLFLSYCYLSSLEDRSLISKPKHKTLTCSTNKVEKKVYQGIKFFLLPNRVLNSYKSNSLKHSYDDFIWDTEWKHREPYSDRLDCFNFLRSIEPWDAEWTYLKPFVQDLNVSQLLLAEDSQKKSAVAARSQGFFVNRRRDKQPERLKRAPSNPHKFKRQQR